MKVRIAKFLSDASFTSRRKAEELISKGIVEVNGKIIDSPICFVDKNDTVKIGGKVIMPAAKTELYAFNKPANVMTTLRDTMGRKTIYDYLPGEYKKLKYVGRLDYKTTGLLLLTNSGELARKLTLPQSRIKRGYIATVKGNDFSSLFKARKGIRVDRIKYRPLKISVLSQGKVKSELFIEATEGKKNEIRVIMRACGLPVLKLHRISFGNIDLGKLPVGKISKIPQKYIDLIIKSF